MGSEDEGSNQVVAVEEQGLSPGSQTQDAKSRHVGDIRDTGLTAEESESMVALPSDHKGEEHLEASDEEDLAMFL